MARGSTSLGSGDPIPVRRFPGMTRQPREGQLERNPTASLFSLFGSSTVGSGRPAPGGDMGGRRSDSRRCPNLGISREPGRLRIGSLVGEPMEGGDPLMLCPATGYEFPWLAQAGAKAALEARSAARLVLHGPDLEGSAPAGRPQSPARRGPEAGPPSTSPGTRIP